MYQFRSKISSYSWLGMLLATTACSPKPVVTQSAIPAPPAPTPALQSSPAPVEQQDGDLYQQALTKADAANAIGQSALSKDDWFLVVNNLENSVQMLKSIAPASSQYILAAKVLPKYEQQLATARQKAVSFVSKSPPISSQVAVLPQGDIFTIPIQQKLGGIPVIEITFNNHHPIQMLLDTGASRTLITQEMANRMQLQPNGNSIAKTANGTAKFQVATIDTIKFGEGEKKDVSVAIGQNDLPYGLLGHDVYDGYDITIKENSIEFRKR
jgi:clan AA aspartic protease (TIGR02281 family)